MANKPRVRLEDNWFWRSYDALQDSVRYAFNGPSHGIISRLERVYSAEMLSQEPDLRFIASCTTGLDHIDLVYCKEKGIKVLSLQGEPVLKKVWATAEHTFALILALARKIPWAFEDVQAGNWNREAFQGTELRGKTLGIIGLGRVGRQVQEIARGFGMRTVAYDPGQGFARGLSRVLELSDVVTVHVPLNHETRHMFSHFEFAAMKDSALFINTSRGEVVDEPALFEALHKHVIAGAALDVMEGEPDKMWLTAAHSIPNLLITPHLGGNTRESRLKTQLFMVDKIKAYLESEGL